MHKLICYSLFHQNTNLTERPVFLLVESGVPHLPRGLHSLGAGNPVSGWRSPLPESHPWRGQSLVGQLLQRRRDSAAPFVPSVASQLCRPGESSRPARAALELSCPKLRFLQVKVAERRHLHADRSFSDTKAFPQTCNTCRETK